MHHNFSLLVRCLYVFIFAFRSEIEKKRQNIVFRFHHIESRLAWIVFVKGHLKIELRNIQSIVQF